jgi:ABC-type uncharacterized transport system substrate-binding protein
MTQSIKRREFISLVSGTAAWPLAARAQQAALPMIGFLNGGSPGPFTDRVRMFRQGLSDTGFVEGRNVAIEYRWADGQNERLPALVAELLHRQVNVIVANTSAVLPAKAATTTIPIVFAISGDPVQLGFVTSLNRPGGNLTGATTLGVEVGAKRLELLHEAVPTEAILALLVNPTGPNAEPFSRDLQAAARTLGLQLHVLNASNERDFDAVFATAVRLGAGGLVIGGDPFFSTRSEQLAALALRHAMPAIYQFGEFAAAGGLMSYGSNNTDGYRLAGTYTGRILKGEKPADLPVQQAARIELIINVKTAKALGLTFPLTLLGRADEVIE